MTDTEDRPYWIIDILPEQVPDWKGLMGDPSDNIPGVPGIGEKTAVKLLSEYGTLENVLEHADSIRGKLGEKLRDGKQSAVFSKKLAQIVPEAPIPWTPAQWTTDHFHDALPLLEEYRPAVMFHGHVHQAYSGASFKRIREHAGVPVINACGSYEYDFPGNYTPLGQPSARGLKKMDRASQPDEGD